MKNKYLLTGVIFVCILFFLSTSVFATGFSNIVSFGDSISDNGSIIGSAIGSPIASLLGLNPVDTPYTDPHGVYHITDGWVWTENLAASMGSTLYDVAYAGASSGEENPIFFDDDQLDDDLIDMINTYVKTTYPGNTEYIGFVSQLPNTGLLSQVSILTDDSNTYYDPYLEPLDMDDTLFTVWAGGNDFLYPINPDPLANAENAADNIGSALTMLAEYGAKNILVPNLPDIGSTPEFYGNPSLSYAASQWTSYFNNELQMTLLEFSSDHGDINLYPFDVYSLFQEFTPGTVEWSAQFWDVDGFHPSASGHLVLAEGAYEALQAGPVPEPATILLLGSGLIGLIGFRRRFRKS